MKFRSIFSALLLTGVLTVSARDFVHPGMSYTTADLDRMRQMIASGTEPYYSTFQALKESSYSKVSTTDPEPITAITEGQFNNTIGADGRRIHDLALLYRLTDNESYADYAVKLLNRYKDLTNCSSRGTAPLDNGKIYLMLEGAELLRDYAGWSTADREAFADMLVHPGYSDTEFPSGHYSLEDASNDITFYWNIYNFDTGRWGNQGLFAARGMMAMGIFLDNEKIYDRALRYVRAQNAREDDIPYDTRAYTRGAFINTNAEGTYNEYKSESKESNPPVQFISDAALPYYIYANGQCQEACRDQGHTMAGLGLLTDMAEMAKSQGDDLYSELDCRILLGLEWAIRYNFIAKAEDGEDGVMPWEPAGFSDNEADCTFDNGWFYTAKSRSPRWEAIKPNSADRSTAFNNVRYFTQALAHYKNLGNAAVRSGASGALEPSRYEWLQKAFDKCVGNGIENWGTSGHHYEWKGWGTLTKLLPARTDGTETSVTQVEADAAADVPSELFSLSGVKVNAATPAPGIYVERRGTSAHTRLIH